MNPFRTIISAFARLSDRISETADRLERENSERLQRLTQYEAEIQRGREEIRGNRERDASARS